MLVKHLQKILAAGALLLIAPMIVQAENTIIINGQSYTCAGDVSYTNGEYTCHEATSAPAATTTGAAATTTAGSRRITGRTCKDHVNGAILSQTQASLLAAHAEVQSPRETSIQTFAQMTVTADMPLGVSSYIQAVQEVLNSCEQHCSGLRSTGGDLFNCEGLALANSNQIHMLVRDDALLADSATSELTEAQLADLFGDEEPAVEAPQVEVTADTGRIDGVSEGYWLRDALFEDQREQTTHVQF